MINTVSSNGHTAYGMDKFIFDTADELADLPVDGHPGSVAFCIATNTTYMLNGSKEWKEITSGSFIAAENVVF